MLDVLQRQTDSSSLSLSSSKHSTIHNSSSATGLKTTITRGQHSRHLRHTKSTIIHNTCQAHSRLQVNSNSQTRRMMFSSNPRLHQAKKEKAGACNTQHPNTLLRDSKSLFSSSRPNSLWTSILSRLRINLAVTKISAVLLFRLLLITSLFKISFFPSSLQIQSSVVCDFRKYCTPMYRRT